MTGQKLLQCIRGNCLGKPKPRVIGYLSKTNETTRRISKVLIKAASGNLVILCKVKSDSYLNLVAKLKSHLRTRLRDLINLFLQLFSLAAPTVSSKQRKVPEPSTCDIHRKNTVNKFSFITQLTLPDILKKRADSSSQLLNY